MRVPNLFSKVVRRASFFALPGSGTLIAQTTYPQNEITLTIPAPLAAEWIDAGFGNDGRSLNAYFHLQKADDDDVKSTCGTFCVNPSVPLYCNGGSCRRIGAVDCPCIDNVCAADAECVAGKCVARRQSCDVGTENCQCALTDDGQTGCAEPLLACVDDGRCRPFVSSRPFQPEASVHLLSQPTLGCGDKLKVQVVRVMRDDSSAVQPVSVWLGVANSHSTGIQKIARIATIDADDGRAIDYAFGNVAFANVTFSMPQTIPVEWLESEGGSVLRDGDAHELTVFVENARRESHLLRLLYAVDSLRNNTIQWACTAASIDSSRFVDPINGDKFADKFVVVTRAAEPKVCPVASCADSQVTSDGVTLQFLGVCTRDDTAFFTLNEPGRVGRLDSEKLRLRRILRLPQHTHELLNLCAHLFVSVFFSD